MFLIVCEIEFGVVQIKKEITLPQLQGIQESTRCLTVNIVIIMTKTNFNSDYEEHLIESGLNPQDLEDPETYVNSSGGYTQISIDELDKKIAKEIEGFTDLLGTLATTEERKKSLWKQIYENAVTDRRNAFILFGDLYSMVANKNSEHAIHGQTLTKYMERMSKANEQLIKLAELVSQAIDENVEEEWSEDQMYDALEKSNSKKSH